MKSLASRIAAGVIVGLSFASPSVYAGPDDAPAAAAQPAGRTVEQIMADVQQTGMSIGPMLGSPDAFMDPTKRAEVAPKVIPPLKKMVGYAKELEALGGPTAEGGKEMAIQISVMLAMFGDAEASAMIETMTTSTDPKMAVNAKIAKVMVAWAMSNKEAGAQAKVLDDAEALTKAHPESDDVAGAMMQLAQMSPANDEIKKRATSLTDGMTAPVVAQIKAGASGQAEAEGKQAAMENKPLVIEGSKVDGSNFTTADWKGKVVLVDFWATWCGPCIAELPRVKKIYKEYHDKGFEILGVSCDRDAEALNKFVAADPEMPWPQLFDKSNPELGWHPIAKAFGINGIPTMYLIDKKGVLRTVNARENFEEMIPKLLAE